jgi:hypothetical protein
MNLWRTLLCFTTAIVGATVALGKGQAQTAGVPNLINISGDYGLMGWDYGTPGPIYGSASDLVDGDYTLSFQFQSINPYTWECQGVHDEGPCYMDYPSYGASYSRGGSMSMTLTGPGGPFTLPV